MSETTAECDIFLLLDCRFLSPAFGVWHFPFAAKGIGVGVESSVCSLNSKVRSGETRIESQVESSLMFV